jgi:hypothetical protein
MSVDSFLLVASIVILCAAVDNLRTARRELGRIAKDNHDRNQ